MYQWPKDNEAALIAYYGHPGPEVERQLVKVVPPFVMRYQGTPIKHLLFHRKAAPALAAALEQVWRAAGRDQARLDRDGVSTTAGTYNPRKIAGSDRWSNHAFGAALDLDADRNGFGKGKGTIPQYVIDAFDGVDFRWGGRYKGRTDPMHFEACDDGRARPAHFMDLMLPPLDENFEEWDGLEPHVKGLAFADMHDDEHEDEAAERSSGRGFFGRVRNWIASLGAGGGFLGIGALTDWKIAIILLGFIFIVGAIGVGGAFWLFGKDRVREWVARHVA